MLSDVSAISCNNDTDLGAIIAEAYEKVGKDGVVFMESSETDDTYVDIVDGVQFDCGITSPHFVTDTEKHEAILEEPLVLIVGSEIPMGLTPAAEGKIAFTTREPIGLVVAISAFNHPLNLIVHQVAPAVATGCPVIVKPADDTPLSCQRFISILAEAGLPEGWAQMACCDVSLAQKMVTDQRINFFSFIGSAKNMFVNTT